MAKLIDSITLPSGLRGLSLQEVRQVVDELRDELIETISTCGGHFASSLGAAEISVVLHHLFDTPHDRLIWDVGHQGYIHKMLTGRRGEMGRIRTKDGISGFLKRNESEFDAFGAGHAGTSISAAVGMATALQRTDPSRYVVSVIGDGSMTAGMAFEALNHAGALGLKNFIVVLNDNEMSISPNVGALSWLFSRAVTSKTSNMARSGFKNLYKKGLVPELVYRAIDKAEEAAQSFFATPSMLFEAFGFRYIGPVDGHDVEALVDAITRAKAQDVPVLVHASTLKGKGYSYAEEDCITWHAVSPFDRSKGVFRKGAKTPPTYTSVFADTLVRLAQEDEKVIGITAAMAGGTGLDKLQEKVPNAYVDVGICEQHAVTFAAGMACEGYKPVCAIYSTFLQRAYDQVLHDVCIQRLPVVFAMDRGGVVGNDGETHQGVFDIAYLRTIPHIVLASPKDENELQHMLKSAIDYGCPVGLRYPRGAGTGIELDLELKTIPLGKGEVVQEGEEILFICFGPMTQYGLAVASRIEKEFGVRPTVVNARFAKPLDEELIEQEVRRHAHVYTIEDHALMGGFGSAILEFVQDKKIPLENHIERFGVADEFVTHATQAEQHHMNGYDPESIFLKIGAKLQKRRLVVGG